MEIELIDSRYCKNTDFNTTYDIISCNNKYYIGFNLIKTFNYYLAQNDFSTIKVFNDPFLAMKYYQAKFIK